MAVVLEGAPTVKVPVPIREDEVAGLGIPPNPIPAPAPAPAPAPEPNLLATGCLNPLLMMLVGAGAKTAELALVVLVNPVALLYPVPLVAEAEAAAAVA